MLNILNYEDYRVLLHDWFWASKNLNPKFSFRYVSRHLGLSSPNHFHLVISQRRHLSAQIFEKVMRLMKLNSFDKQYLKILFKECQAKTATDRDKLRAQRDLMKSSRGASQEPDNQMLIIGNRVAWFIKMGAIVFEGKTRSDITKIALQTASFPITIKEIDQAIDILTSSRQLEFDNGLSRFEGGNILTEWDFNSADIKRHHSSNLSLAIESLSWPIDQRFHSGVTIPCNDELYQAIIDDVRSLCLSILERSNRAVLSKTDVSKVATLQLALFPFFKFQ